MYVKDYTATVDIVHDVYDGDTYWLYLNPGFRSLVFAHIRLQNWDTPEMRSSSGRKVSAFEKRMAVLAREEVIQWFNRYITDPSVTVWCRTSPDPDESMDRWVGHIWADSEFWAQSLGEFLREVGLAVPSSARNPQHWYQTFDPTGSKL